MKKFLLVTTAIFLFANMTYSQCEPISTFPWTEGFENNDTNLPPCWEQEGSLGWNWNVVQGSIGTPATAHSGNYKAQIYINLMGDIVYYTSLVTPVFDFSAVIEPELSFWHTQTGRGGLMVFYKNAPNGWWILLQSLIWDVGSIPDWQKDNILLPEKSDYYQIAFLGNFYGGGMADVQLDDISIRDGRDFYGIEAIENALNIYPNPTTGELTMDNGQLTINNVDVFDIYGKCHLSLVTRHETSVTLNISHLSSGLYFIKIFTESGMVVKNVVKQ